ncbi:hypothetical protein Hanom_Chr10g00903501 [Helianthus anomalus]
MTSVAVTSFPTSLPEPPPLMMSSMDEVASLAFSCFNIISLWHLEHMFMVATLPKKPQLLTQRMGPSGAAVSLVDSICIKFYVQI